MVGSISPPDEQAVATALAGAIAATPSAYRPLVEVVLSWLALLLLVVSVLGVGGPRLSATTLDIGLIALAVSTASHSVSTVTAKSAAAHA